MRYVPIAAVCVVIAGCSGTTSILGKLSGRDTELAKSLAGGTAVSGCGLATSDGHIRLIEAGKNAVVDLAGKPTALKLQSDSGAAGKAFGNGQTRVAVSFVADALDSGGQIIGHKAGVTVNSEGKFEHFYGLWTC
jgi:hypothetical protein